MKFYYYVCAASLLFIGCGKKEDKIQANKEALENNQSTRVLTGVTAENAMTKMLKDKTFVYENGSYKATQVKNAKHYLVYVSASW